MSECVCPCPTCDDEHSATLMELDEARHMQRSLECELSATRIALDAAEDEIEKLISEKEALRAERDDIQHRFDLTWEYAAPRVTVMTTVQNPASAPGGGS